ncbi:MAG: AI-2E family transporter [Flavobacteriales bacterium]|nr:AI-2E family transporter [Flavobacteriales bacterium]
MQHAPPLPHEPVPTGPVRDPLLHYVLVLLALIGSVTVLHYGRDLFVLLFIAGIFSFLLLPLCQGLQRRGWPLWLAAGTGCVLLVLMFFGLLYFLGSQYAHFGKDLPGLQAALMHKIELGQTYVEGRFNVAQARQSEWVQDKLEALIKSSGSVAVNVFSATGAAFATALVIPIITFFLLLMKGRFREFFLRLAPDHDGTVLRLVENIAGLSRQWLKGLITVVFFLAVLDSIGFLVLGLEYAVLLGVTAALLNVIPYLGPWLGAIVPLLIALLTKDSMMYALGVVGVIATTQFIDNNFITPKVVGSSVSLNPLASMIALLAWGTLWGFMGLLLAIPITGMMKLVFDEITPLKPWGFLLGEEKKWPKEKRFKLSLPVRRKKQQRK